MRLVADWKRAHRWFSTRAMAASAAVQLAWVGLPESLRSHIPQWLVSLLAIGLLVAGAFGRIVKQEDK
jgi:hypothetical protein